jgi:hypothetical protein
MQMKQFMLATVLVLSLGWGVRSALAAEPAATGGTPTNDAGKVAAPPAGLRVMFDGNSWFPFVVRSWVGDLVKAAGIQGHRAVKGSKPNEPNPIAVGDVDVYTHGVHWWTGPIAEAPKLLASGLQSNPNFRVYYQAAWLMGDGRHLFPEGRRDRIKVIADYDLSDLADVQNAISKTRKSVEDAVDKINQQYGKSVVFIVPVGDAVTKLRAMIVAGTYPGLTKQSELWNDAMPHPGSHVMALQAYCHFAVIYHMSPKGLALKGFTDEQLTILQKIAWETVSEDPYAGIKEVAKPQGAAKVEPVATTNAAPASAVPAELKGWQATTGLPDKAVITDYNDYIKELPQAERERVADVRYFTDGTGQNAVAITVNGKDGAWMSILVYDKQNKRLRVLKQAPHDAVAGCGAGGSIL